MATSESSLILLLFVFSSAHQTACTDTKPLLKPPQTLHHKSYYLWRLRRVTSTAAAFFPICITAIQWKWFRIEIRCRRGQILDDCKHFALWSPLPSFKMHHTINLLWHHPHQHCPTTNQWMFVQTGPCSASKLFSIGMGKVKLSQLWLCRERRELPTMKLLNRSFTVPRVLNAAM